MPSVVCVYCCHINLLYLLVDSYILVSHGHYECDDFCIMYV